MGKKRLTVLKIREILRLHFDAHLSNRQIKDCQRISKTTVQRCLERFSRNGFSWPLPMDLSDDVLHQRLYPEIAVREGKPQPDWELIHKEMSKQHVTAQLLWEEYRDTVEGGLGRTQFYECYSRFRKTQIEPVFRLVHKGGEKLFIDFSGDGLSYVDRSTGEIVSVVLFVASWGASSYSFAEAAMDRTLRNWIRLNRHMLRYFACVPGMIVPDNEKTAVTEADKYEPVVHPTYAAFGEHYDTVILPTRPNKPRDKAVVESNVLHIQRFILGRLRNRTFFSLGEINEAIRELLVDYNDRPMQQYKESRRQRFEELDKPFAKPLPADDFPYVIIKINVLVANDYHIEYGKHFYSVPHALCGSRVEVRQTDQIVEIFCRHERVASHPVGTKQYGRTTQDEHMPKEHQFVKGWSPEYFLGRAQTVGKNTVELFTTIMAASHHKEVSYRCLMGMLNLKKTYPVERLENAASRAMYFGQKTLRALKSILEKGLDKEPLPNGGAKAVLQLPLFHENIRGAEYYDDRRVAL